MGVGHLIIVVLQMRIQGDTFPEHLDGLVVLLQAQVGLAEKVIRIGIGRLDFRSLAQKADGHSPVSFDG